MRHRLSLEKKIVVSALVIILLFALILWGTVRDRTLDYYRYHQSIAQSTVENIAHEVEHIIQNKHKLVATFLDDHDALMLKILENIEDGENYEILDDKLKQYFPDYFSSSVANIKGELLRTEFGNISQLCLKDMKDFIHHGVQHIRIHPNANLYHYDVLIRFRYQAEDLLFIATFTSDEIVSLLNTLSILNHNFFLVDKNRQYLIEVTKYGSRNSLKDRDDLHLTAEEQERILASKKVAYTRWTVVDSYDDLLFSDNSDLLIRNNLIVFVIFTLFMIFVSRAIMKEIQKKEQLKNKLEHKNSEIKALNENLERLSITDSLTGLYNRRFLDSHLQEAWNKATRLDKPLCIAMIDVDFFKQYNDYYGHQEGDDCLVTIANLCLENFRRANEMCVRYGGEEFVIINIGEEREDFIKRLEDLFRLLEKKAIKHEDSSIGDKVTISIGLAHSKEKLYHSAKELLKSADDALYEAKKKGRNQMVVAL